MNLEPGGIVGDYQIIATLGAGGMGKVFKVRNTISDRVEALKVLLPDLAGEPELADRFLREIKVLASLDHPNIAGLRTALRVENQLFMVMEYVEGLTLEDRLLKGRIPVPDVVNYIRQVLSALAYAHHAGVIHRDIKPANMMLTTDGVVKLMDFGIAKGAGDRRLTMTGTTMGSLYYMSPEQIQGSPTLDVRADLYSVGVSLYELATGRRPFDGDSQFAIMHAHLTKDPVPPVSVDPSIAQQLSDLIVQSVNRDPGSRFQTADAFQHALSAIGDAVAAAAMPESAIPTLPLTSPVVPPRTAPTVTLPLAAAPPAPPLSATAMATTPVPPQPAPRPAQIPQTPAAPPPAAAAKPNRALWVAAGALCCAAVLVAAIEFVPWKQVAAGPAQTPASTATTAAPTTPQQTPAQPQTPAAPAQAQTPAVPQATAPQVSPAPVQAPAPEVRQSSGAPSPPRRPQQAVRAVEPAAPLQPPPPSAAQAPAQPPAQPVQPAQPPPAPPAAPQPDQSAQRAELQQLRVSLATLTARASAIHGTLNNLQRSQAASGLGLRRDWVQAASLMDSFLRGASDAINASDVANAHDLMQKAEIQLEKLEKALN
jgi:serine/threonine-protein kinase